MKRALFVVMALGIFAGEPVLLERRAEACTAPWWGTDTCGCSSTRQGYFGCGTNGITCVAYGLGCGDGPGRSPP
jgi:hypothetical protein